MKDKSSASKIAIGAGIGAAIGVITGILIAPKSGKETRKDIKSFADKSVAKAESKLKELHAEMGKLIEKSQQKMSSLSSASKKKLQTAVDKASKAKANLAKIISAVRTGEATDDDLKRALDDAKSAKNHLKTFLKS